MAITVVIGHRGAHPKEVRPEPGFRGYIREGAIPIVAIEGRIERPFGMKKLGLSRIHEQNVHPTVVVVVENRDTRRNGLGQVPVIGAGVDVRPPNSCFVSRCLPEGHVI